MPKKEVNYHIQTKDQVATGPMKIHHMLKMRIQLRSMWVQYGLYLL